MPVVKSHQKLFYKDSAEAPVNETESFEDIDIVVCSIASNILRDSPGLIAEAAGGRMDERLLETAVIRDIESHKYRYGIFRDELIRRVIDFMSGYGVLQRYIEDEDITDIDGTRFDQFMIKRHGIRSKIPVSFGSAKILDTYCRALITRNGAVVDKIGSFCRAADEKNRMRISISVGPENATGPAISIRKHRMESYRVEDLQAIGMLDGELTSLLRRLAATDASVIFCGRSAAGKTTLMRAFINILPEMERVLIIESDAEVYPDKPYCIEQRIKAKIGEDRSAALKGLIRDGQAMPVDSCCVGEITGDEVWEFVKAIFYGFRGITTMFSENAGAVLPRLLTLSRCAGIAESENAVKEMLGRSVNAIFYLKDFKVAEVLEVAGYDGVRDVFDYKRLYPYSDPN